MKKYIFFSAIALLALVTLGCEKDSIDKNLIGTWKCIGFGNNKTDKVKPIEPKNCNKCYIITFKENGIFEGRSCFNTLKGQYKLNKKQLKFINIWGTDVGEMEDCLLFTEIIKKTNIYNIKKNKLFLYYSNAEYLLFELKTEQ